MPKIYRQSITAAKDSPFQEGDIAVFIAPEQNESSLRKIDAMTQFVRPPGVVLRPAGRSYDVVAELSGTLHAKHTDRSRSSIEIVHALGTPPCPYLSFFTEPHSSTLAD